MKGHKQLKDGPTTLTLLKTFKPGNSNDKRFEEFFRMLYTEPLKSGSLKIELDIVTALVKDDRIALHKAEVQRRLMLLAAIGNTNLLMEAKDFDGYKIVK